MYKFSNFRAAFTSIWIHCFPVAAVRYELPTHFFVTVFWFGSTLFLAVVVPQIGVVIKVLGALAAVFIFVFPGDVSLSFCRLFVLV